MDIDVVADVNGVALVAGAGSDIGREVSKALALRGISFIICADIDLESAKEAASYCVAYRSKALPALKPYYHHVDVTDEKSVQHLLDETKRICGRIDHFVNATGISPPSQTFLPHTTLSDYRAMIESHNIGSFLCIRAVLRVMLEQGPKMMVVAGRKTISTPRHLSRGSIVIVTSLAAESVAMGMGAYASAKKAVKQYAALESASKTIRINAVAPTYVQGPMLGSYLAADPGLKVKMTNSHALGRLITAEEVADTVVFLTSAAASYVNGQTLVLDGGSALHLGTTGWDEI
ncbi:MAG: hypothetical protein Q9170_008032 [Blastenia crenularia]